MGQFISAIREDTREYLRNRSTYDRSSRTSSLSDVRSSHSNCSIPEEADEDTTTTVGLVSRKIATNGDKSELDEAEWERLKEMKLINETNSTPKANPLTQKFKALNLDPRSPSGIPRTPIVVGNNQKIDDANTSDSDYDKSQNETPVRGAVVQSKTSLIDCTKSSSIAKQNSSKECVTESLTLSSGLVRERVVIENGNQQMEVELGSDKGCTLGGKIVQSSSHKSTDVASKFVSTKKSISDDELSLDFDTENQSPNRPAQVSSANVKTPNMNEISVNRSVII